MCGRFSLSSTPEEVKEHYRLNGTFKISTRYNIAPTQETLVVKQLPNSFKLHAINMRWGLIPSWSKDSKIGNKLINARSETLIEKPSFRNAYKKRRCLIPASGFYEWDSNKHPHFISMKGGGLFSLAGLWEEWKSQEGQKITSFAIITTEANGVVGKIHERMPAIIDPTHYGLWLSDSTDTTTAGDFLRPFSPFKMTSWMVSKIVNSPANDSEVCVKKI